MTLKETQNHVYTRDHIEGAVVVIARIKYPALIQASMLVAIVYISIMEEIFGIYAGDQKQVVIASMALWIMVLLTISPI